MVPALLPAAVAAQSFDCRMADGSALAFRIDPNQFVTAVTPEEPIRRKVTLVRMDGATVEAEPFLLGEIRGFHALPPQGGSIMFTVMPDGTATRSEVGSDARLTGQCEVQ